MSAVIAATCVCGSLGRADLRRCPDHHHLWRGDKRLTGVSTVLKLWPLKPCDSCGAVSYDGHAPGCPVYVRIENAMLRGKEVDALFSAYVIGKLQSIPTGTRHDSRDLLLKLVKWFQARKVGAVESQVLVGDSEIGGVCDLWMDGMVMDLKCVYEVTDAHILQVAAYHELMNWQGRDAQRAAILHCTERYAEPKVIPLTTQDHGDWKHLRQYWSVVQRRTA